MSETSQSQAIRRALLRVLYDARRAHPAAGWCWERDLETAAGAPINFELSYLVERGLVRQDGPKFRITALGIDAHEQEI